MSTILIVLFVVLVLGGMAALVFMWVLRSGLFHSHLVPKDDDDLVGHPDDLAAIETMTSEAAAQEDQANDQDIDQDSEQSAA